MKLKCIGYWISNVFLQNHFWTLGRQYTFALGKSDIAALALTNIHKALEGARLKVQIVKIINALIFCKKSNLRGRFSTFGLAGCPALFDFLVFPTL